MKNNARIEHLILRKQELEKQLDVNTFKLENMLEHESKRETENIYIANDNIFDELDYIEEQLMD